MPRFFVPCFVLLFITALPAAAQEPRPADVASPEAIVTAAYEALVRAPGENFDWDRTRTLFHPRAVLLPNTEQTGGIPQTFSLEEFIAWIDGWYAANAPIGGPNDQGFAEEAIHNEVRRYGDVANVFSTYQKRFYGSDEILGRGLNSFQLVFRDGRWWIVSIVWDEENGAGPLPAPFLGE